MKKHIYPYLLIALFGLISCEETIDIDVDEGEPQLTVDAWLTDQPGLQTIRLTMSQAYFANEFNDPALGAEVAVVSLQDSSIYNFTDPDADGSYTWGAEEGESFVEVGGQYGLGIAYQDKEFFSLSRANPVPDIDSLVFVYEEEELGQPEGYYGELFATDLPGVGDCYWIKAYKNGEFLNKPSEINIAFDAGFSQGTATDGITFIAPVRSAVNPVPNPDDDPAPGYEVGDSLYVEIHAIPQEAFYYMIELQGQLQNGGLFATPTANVPTNIFNADENDDTQALGFFAVSSVSSEGNRLEP